MATKKLLRAKGRRLSIDKEMHLKINKKRLEMIKLLYRNLATFVYTEG